MKEQRNLNPHMYMGFEYRGPLQKTKNIYTKYTFYLTDKKIFIYKP